MSLKKLWERWRKRRAGRKRQIRLFRRTGKRGHARKAGEHGRAMRKLMGLISRARKLYSLLPGPPSWGGSKRLIREKVAPLVERRGISRTSAKRSETFGNPGSDHYIGNVLAYAEDYATADNQALAQEIRSALDPGAAHQDYERFYTEFRGHTYRVQIIASTHGTGPHLHVGSERVD